MGCATQKGWTLKGWVRWLTEKRWQLDRCWIQAISVVPKWELKHAKFEHSWWQCFVYFYFWICCFQPFPMASREHNSQRTHLHALVCTCTIRVLHRRHDMTWHHITSNYILSHPPYSILTYYIRIHTSIHPHTDTHIYILYIHTSYRIPGYLIMS